MYLTFITYDKMSVNYMMKIVERRGKKLIGNFKSSKLNYKANYKLILPQSCLSIYIGLLTDAY